MLILGGHSNEVGRDLLFVCSNVSGSGGQTGGPINTKLSGCLDPPAEKAPLVFKEGGGVPCTRHVPHGTNGTSAKRKI